MAARTRLRGRTVVSGLLHRARPLVPPSGWDVLAMTATFRAGGPLLVRPAFRRALVLAPHPDDEVIGCGGTVALLAAGGCDVAVTIATDGGALRLAGVPPAEVGRRRRAEADAAASVLGTRAPEHLGYADGGLGAAGPGLAGDLSAAVAAARPEAIFVPWPLDGHPDHEALAPALAAAVVAPATEVWCYEVWQGLPANRMVDVTAIGEVKRRALAEHRTPAAAVDTTAHLSLQRWRSAAVLQGRGEAEAFLVLRFSTFAELVAHQVRAAAR